jgi:Flp pilus assembly protein TadG
MRMYQASSVVLRTLRHSPPDGVAIVEFALILPLLILLMVGLFDLGFGSWQYMQVQAAAEAGAQYASLYPGDTAGIAAAATGATGTSGASATSSQMCGCAGDDPFKVADWVGTQCVPATTCTSGSPPGVYVLVTVQLSYSPVLPYPGWSNPMTLNGHAYRRLQ